MTDLTAIYPILVGVITFPLSIYLLCLLLSRVSGWSQVARVFPASQVGSGEPQGERFRWANARFHSLTPYDNCLTIILADQGIYLRVFRLFAFGHKPIMVPRAEIEKVTTSRGLFKDRIELQLSSPPLNTPKTLTLTGGALVRSVETWFQKMPAEQIDEEE